MFIIASMYTGLAVVILTCFVAEPREVGIDMADDHLRPTIAQQEGEQPAENDNFTSAD